MLHFPTRKHVGYFGAVRVRDGKFTYAREEDKFNAATYWNFLKHLRRISSHSGRRVVVVQDNARYHQANLHKEWRRICPKRFSIDFLPPYSPELNTIERTWKLTRRLCLHNRYFDSLDAVVSSVEHQFEQWKKSSSILRKLCAIT